MNKDGLKIRTDTEVTITDTGQRWEGHEDWAGSRKGHECRPNRQEGTYPAVTPGQHSVMDLPGCPYWTPVEGTSEEGLFLSLSPDTPLYESEGVRSRLLSPG